MRTGDARLCVGEVMARPWVMHVFARLACCAPNSGKPPQRLASDAAPFRKRNDSLAACAPSESEDVPQAAGPQCRKWARASRVSEVSGEGGEPCVSASGCPIPCHLCGVVG